MNPVTDDKPHTTDNSVDLFDDPRLVEVVAEFQQELASGKRPDRAAYLNRYPELTSAIAECLDGLQLLHGGMSGGSASSLKPKPDALAETSLRPAQSILGDFRIVGEIARGGMGIVYEAVQLSLNRRVALKVLPFASNMDSRHLQRFKIEAQAAALLHHTHIVPIYAVGCERGVHFYAMQLIEGQSLAAVLQGLRQQNGHTRLPQALPQAIATQPVQDQQPEPAAVSSSGSQETLRSTANVSATMTAGNAVDSEGYLRRAAQLMIQAAEALEHAHQSGVVHRDIKPANLLIDRLGNLWITDFGLAQLQSESGITRSNDMLGTFRYMSPEQTGGQRTVLDHRTDIYSLGATFYELATLQPAFTGATHQELLYQILHTEPRRPRELNRALPSELETIILKALNKSPAERYATAADLAADLQRYLNHQPILARRPSLLERLRKWSRRHPSLIATGVLLLTVITVGSLVGNWLIAEEQLKTREALVGQQTRAEEAEARFAQARQAVDALFQISEEELTDKPVEVARKRILQVVLTHYEEFIEQRSGDKASQAELAQVQLKVKAILHELNVLQHPLDTRLLDRPQVQAELHLDDAQSESLKALITKWKEQSRDLDKTMRKVPEATKRAALVEQTERQDAELQSVLSDDQLKRFRQLAIQSRGLFAFKDHDIIQALTLTVQQRSRIRDIEREMFHERSHSGDRFDWNDNSPDRRDEDRRRNDNRPKEPKPMRFWVEKVLKSLTRAQRTKWTDLTGEYFAELDRPGPPGPR